MTHRIFEDRALTDDEVVFVSKCLEEGGMFYFTGKLWVTRDAVVDTRVFNYLKTICPSAIPGILCLSQSQILELLNFCKLLEDS